MWDGGSVVGHPVLRGKNFIDNMYLYFEFPIILNVQEVLTHFTYQVTKKNGSRLPGHTVGFE